jgi:hypothetical protein
MSKSTKISIEVIRYPTHFVYNVSSPAGIKGMPVNSAHQSERLAKVLDEVKHLLEVCEDVALKEAFEKKEKVI